MEIALSRGQQLPGEGIAALWGGGDVAREIVIDEIIHVPDGPLSARAPSPGKPPTIHEFPNALRSF